MSKYTTEVRYICEDYAGLDQSSEYPDVEDVISASKGKIFDDFPIFDEAYRGVLEQKILRHYYTREIGFETVALWKLKLNTKMNEIMPYYNQLYKSELIQFNPLYDIDLTRDYKRDTKGENSGENNFTGREEGSASSNATNESTSWNKFNDTPQGGLQGIDSDTYLTSATKVTNESEDKTGSTHGTFTRNEGDYSNNMTGLEDYIEHISGVNGGLSYSKRLKEFRDTFLNIDMEIIKDLKDLFFYLW